MTDRFRFRVWNDMQKCYSPDDHYIDEDGELNTDGKYIVEQCTGLKDKNGELVYEGDLIKSPNNNNLLEVIWEKGVWQTKEYREKGMHELFLYILATEYGVEIVGNIHEKESK